MMRRRTITLLSMFLLLGGPYASFAQEGEQASRSAPYRIGIFPGGGCFGTTVFCPSLSAQTVRLLQAPIQSDNALVLGYSYYDDVLNEPRIKNRDRLWAGGATRKRPKLELVYQMGRERDLDGVVMLWGIGVASADLPSAGEMPIEFYMIDIKHRQVYHRKGTAERSSVAKTTKKLLAQFLDGRPQVMQAKAAEAIEPVASKRQEVISPLTEAEGGTSHADTIYREGYRFSVQQDHTKAVIWYRTAAEEGHAGAQYNLGAAYANGTGVSADQETAVDWFFKAGQAFLKEDSRAKARQAVTAIEHVAPGHVLGQRLRAAIQQSQ